MYERTIPLPYCKSASPQRTIPLAWEAAVPTNLPPGKELCCVQREQSTKIPSSDVQLMHHLNACRWIRRASRIRLLMFIRTYICTDVNVLYTYVRRSIDLARHANLVWKHVLTKNMYRGTNAVYDRFFKFNLTFTNLAIKYCNRKFLWELPGKNLLTKVFSRNIRTRLYAAHAASSYN
jgi:hypothetical protein